MGFHNFDTNFTLDPRVDINNDRFVTTRGEGNQVSVEFNLLYRFHCAISEKDEQYTEEFMREEFLKDKDWDAKSMNLDDFMGNMMGVRRRAAETAAADAAEGKKPTEIWENSFGLRDNPAKTPRFERNKYTGLFDDKVLIGELEQAMNDPICKY
jgi:hypothetical protein